MLNSSSIVVRNVEVSTFADDGDVAYDASAICRLLGFSSVSDVLRALDDEQKGVCARQEGGTVVPVSVINASGMRTLSLLSPLPDARSIAEAVLSGASARPAMAMPPLTQRAHAMFGAEIASAKIKQQ